MQRSNRIAALHKKSFAPDQKTIITHAADAHGGFPPSAAAAAVPLWRLNTFIPTGPELSRGPLFLT
ncbi:hypothetical protein GHK56_06790 [Sinorhizobium meliloti]|nr:hypothetical protein [Sinorhizobium meliloti]